MCVGFLYTLTCMRPRTLVVVVSKKESRYLSQPPW